MEIQAKTFGISFKDLLFRVTKALDWPEPEFSQAGLSANTANVLINRNPWQAAYTIEGVVCASVEESEETVAKKAIMYLESEHGLEIDDFSLGKKKKIGELRFEYLEKQVAFTNIERQLNFLPTKVLRMPPAKPILQVVPINFWTLLSEIVAEYRIQFPEFSSRVLSSGKFYLVCKMPCVESDCGYKWIIGENSQTMEGARQWLAKELVNHLQVTYGFRVLDYNLGGVALAKLHCELAKEGYLTVKERVEHLEETGDSEEILNSECPLPQVPGGPICGTFVGSMRHFDSSAHSAAMSNTSERIDGLGGDSGFGVHCNVGEPRGCANSIVSLGIAGNPSSGVGQVADSPVERVGNLGDGVGVAAENFSNDLSHGLDDLLGNGHSDEGDICMTPREIESQIQIPMEIPPAPKKRRSSPIDSDSRPSPNTFPDPGDLNKIFSSNNGC